MDIARVFCETFNIAETDAQKFNSKFVHESLPKNSYFLRTGERCSKFSFIASGLVRVFAETEKKEVTQWIGNAGYFLTDVSSFLFQQPARWNICALSETTLWTLSYDDYIHFEKDLPEWNMLEKRFVAKCFAMMESRIFDFISLSAEERYAQYFKLFPHHFNQVPLQYIASVLGMSPETLSRIRAR
ncbi:Crp/Fnr family transcriptional regulator [Sphingobacterium deserti]|uniref:Putative transcriptional regulator, Crp/Fnr family n=1 Tax=Sphingobacterium deserti TaxID=1229276 RepID=A0A0B8T967_9SPHI|nr:Crp/Fnr family transcriptional regulator [Sphingobacterium deserti]KGE15229.1 putative transcriptional regulator, Crp/Fnr family [Sphingobacterium deserti]